MEWNQLDNALDELERSTPSVPSGIQLFRPTKHEWSKVWDLCKEIQAAFKGVRYPTVAERQAAWERFCRLRNEASRRKSIESDRLTAHSSGYRKEILELTERARWSRIIDTVFFFDPTSKEEMKQLGSILGRARRMLSEHKAEMFADHKQECFQAIVDAQATHDEYWHRYKAELGRRQAEWEVRQSEHRARQAQWEQRQAERSARIRANIEKNRDGLSKAIGALHRQEARAEEIRDKMRETNSPKWVSIYSEWLSETATKIDDIESSIRRLREWIDEGEQQLRGG